MSGSNGIMKVREVSVEFGKCKVMGRCKAGMRKSFNEGEKM